MVRGFLVAVLTLGLSASVLADIKRAQECERDGIRRTLELVAKKVSGVPCQVVYSKPMEDQSSTILWNAQNDKDYCKTKYLEFISKLETKLNWSCSALTNQISSPDKQSDRVAQRSDTLAIPTVRKARPGTSTPDEQESSIAIRPSTTDQTPGNKNTGVKKSSTTSQPISINSDELSTDKPILSAAFPDIVQYKEPDRGITLKTIQRHFPSGHYATSANVPHTGDVSLCPAAGFYVWNTQHPDKPTFEMGMDAVFIFNLDQIVENSLEISGNSDRHPRCNYDIQSTFCLDNQLQGQTLASADIDRLLKCRRRGSATKSVRRLALISTLSGSTNKHCVANAPAAFMGMASLPVTAPGDEEYGSEGFEMIIVENASASSNRANCRYFRGS